MASKRFDGYIRVSQKGGRAGESFRSPEQQRTMIEQWAAAKGATIVEWHEDIDVSGSRMDRPGLNDARARIRGGLTDGVVVAFLDRFTRAKVGEAMAVLDEITTDGGSVAATDLPGLDPADKYGEYQLTNAIAMKRLEWRTAAERWDTSRSDAVRDGKAPGGCPFGYRYTDPTPKPLAADGSRRGVLDSRLMPDERAAPIVLELFERKAGGATWLELARWLDTVAAKPNGGHWSRNTVNRMISCRTYLGEIRHGKHVNPNAHTPIVPAALWRRAQNPPGRRTPRGTYLLSGLVKCAGCSHRMKGTTGGPGKGQVFRCATAGCPSEYVTVTVARLDAEVVEQFFAHLDDFHLQTIDDEALDDARADVELRTGEVERLAAVVPSHPTAVKAHQLALSAAEDALASAEDRVAHLASLAAQAGPDLRTLREDWPDLTLDEQREILRASIAAVLVRRASRRTAPRPPISERVKVLFVGDEIPDGLVDNGRSGQIRSWAWDDEPGSLVAAA